MSEAVGVLILDEPQNTRATFRATLEHRPEFQTIGEQELDAGGPGEAVALVFIDEARLEDGLARLGGLKERHPALRALVAFDVLPAQAARALLAAGADAFVARSRSPAEMAATLLALAAGSAPLPAASDAEPSAEEGASDGLGLTPREAEILRFLSSGFSNKEVARRLTLSVRTVETHRLNLRRKTQTGRLKDLVSLARQLGLAPVVDAEPVRRVEAGPPGPGRLARH